MIELKDQNKYDISSGRPPIKLIYNGKEMTLKEYARLNDISYIKAYRIYKKEINKNK